MYSVLKNKAQKNGWELYFFREPWKKYILNSHQCKSLSVVYERVACSAMSLLHTVTCDVMPMLKCRICAAISTV